MTRTGNEKYVKRGTDTFTEYNPGREWRPATQTKAGAPHQYSETLIMPAAALRVGLGVRYSSWRGES